MADLTGMMQAAAGVGGEEADEYFQNTVLLLHGDGINGQQNNVFLDSSSNAFAITRNGEATQGTFSPFSKPDGGWGNYFDGSGDYLTVPDNVAFDVGTGDFTIEAFVYHNNAATSEEIYCTHTTNGIQISRNSSGKFAISQSGVGQLLAGSTTLNAGTFYHVAAVRNGTNLKVYVNGSEDGSTTNSTNLAGNSTFFISANAGINGFLSNLRLVKGTAITPPAGGPTSPLTAITNTSLLTCQSNRFKDNSTNNFAITVAGNTKVTPFSPFPLTTEYTASINGGSGYFDGTGDYLVTPTDNAFALGGTFVLEAWVYPTSYNPNNGCSLFDVRDTNEVGSIGIKGTGTAGQIGWQIGPTTGDSISTTKSIPLYAWTYVVAVSDANGTSIFLDGVRDANSATQATWPSTARDCWIGGPFGGGAGFNFFGWMADARVIKGGTLPYASTSTTITVPTAPLTAIANTSLLCNFTNSGILDNTCFNDLITVGDAAVNTTTKKYGTGSMEFDGSDYLQLTDRTNFDFGTGDFTIEGWVYLATSPTIAPYTIIDARSSDVLNEYSIAISATSKLDFIYSASRVTSAASVSTTTWTHVAITRASGTIRLFIGGVLDANTASYSSGINTAAPVVIGGGRSGGTSAITGYYFNGFIDDLRITKGIARYTTTFTPPTAAFPNIGE